MERPNLWIIGFKEEKKRHWKYFQKNHRRKFPQFKERDAYQGARGIQNIKQTESENNFSQHIVIKTPNIQNNKDSVFKKASREKEKVTYKGRSIRTIPDFSKETLKARRTWTQRTLRR